MTSPNINNNLPIVGILGDGQLAMMMAQAYQRLGGKVFIFGSSDNGPASSIADKVFVGDPNKFDDIQTFFKAADVVTLENEFNDGKLLSYAALRCSTRVLPEPSRFSLIEDKLSEKLFFQKLGIGLATFFEVKSENDLLDAQGYLKLAKGGYDGIGTYRVDNKEQALNIYRKIRSSGDILFEHAVDFKKELSVISVSDRNQAVFYPTVETHQEHGTCRYVTFPSGINKELEQNARSQVKRILNQLNTPGLFAFEFFVTNDDRLILNESAPRPHNSGHITLDLTDCCQFENHMRAITGLALKEPQLTKESMTMVNLLGTKEGPFNSAHVTDRINDTNSSLTLYRKSESRVKRKMGHINLWGPNQKRRAIDLVQNLEI